MSVSQAATFQNLANKFRRLADHASDEATAEHLRGLAAEYERQAARAAATEPAEDESDPAAEDRPQLTLTAVEPASAADETGRRACYRYRTPVLVGPWRRKAERALDDAVAARLAQVEGDGSLRWMVAGEIEESPCLPHAPCGGVYPPAE